MNHIFSFDSNLNNIFLGDYLEKSENSCEYCTKRKRICRCDTMKRELGSERTKDIDDFLNLKKYYDEICEKIVDKYKDVVNRFEYDKDIVMYIKKNKINDEIECEDWLYFYELLKERKVLEKCIDLKQNKEIISLNSFHLDEQANFISCLNYYIKVNKYHNIHHNWMGMSINPFNEYANNNYNSSVCTNIQTNEFNKVNNINDKIFNDDCNVYNIEENEKIHNIISPGDLKNVHPLYYYSYIQDNEKWLSGINNSGNILHLENIDYVWNKTVREDSNKIKLFHLITANCVKNNDMDYNKIKTKKEYNENDINVNIEIERVLCISQLVCALGMMNIGGYFVMKIKLSFDNFLLSVFSILSICFKKLEVYRPSCCYLRNIIFVIGVHFNGIMSIFLSSLKNCVEESQKELINLINSTRNGDYSKEKSDNTEMKNKKMKTNNNSVSSDISPTTKNESNKFLNHSLIPRKWIKSSFFQEYKNCINHFIDYLIYHLKKCINLSNINLIKKNIENTKNTYISQFFEEHKIVDILKKDKLVHKLLDHIYYENNLDEKNNKFNDFGEKDDEIDFILPNNLLENSEQEIFFSNKFFSKIKNTILHYQLEEKGIYFKNNYNINIYCNNNNIENYRKNITSLLKKIKFKSVTNINKATELFQLDQAILKKRIFLRDKGLFSNHEMEFINLLKKQAYFTNKNWFKCYLQNDILNFENPFYSPKTLFKDLLKCRYYIYYKNCDIHINSFKQILKQYEPITTSYIHYELYSSVIDCLFVLKNCAGFDIFKDSSFIQNFLVISTENCIFNFFTKFQTGYHVALESNDPNSINSNDPNSGTEGDTDDYVIHVNVGNMYEKRQSYKLFSELLIQKLKNKNVCSFIYIDLNTIFPNYVHLVEKEIKVKNYFISSLIIAFNYLKKEGNMIIRLSSVLTFFTVGLVYILFCCFEKVSFFVPPSCDDINLDFYIYCFNFNENYIYRHYIQYIWDAVICNQHINEKFNSKEIGANTNTSKSIEAGSKKRKSDIYFSIPLYFVMNKHFVQFIKKFNSFYIKNHINICLNFIKEPKYFNHHKSMIKSLLTNFFKAYILCDDSYEKIYKSITIQYNIFHKKEDISDDEDEDEEDDKIDKHENFNNNLEDGPGNNNFKHLFDLRDKKKNDIWEVNRYENSSGESDYSLIYEYKNVPSEVSISETAWDSP
ncbi:conserved Plasmodium protein, unknown function [Plasmodium chabaudi chabaudi]|uniref:Ribosomal RNA methyltransferase FtsJ domain-containing protein n=1 Tax=Plasmodium chabaudi chabaudi TaxID=31271 RepID=A0A1C6X1F7_PLACU|nr:conserved Plasmodium protein, unknown function [Plasmodium chabaudi chabaudi]